MDDHGGPSVPTAPDTPDKLDKPAAPGVPDMPGVRRWDAAVLVGAFAVLLAVTIWRHEMWRDELQAWQIARDSPTLRDLLHNVRYEGHPLAWFLVLWVTSKVSRAPEAMQVVQWLIAVASVAVLVTRAPFTRTQRALAVFGYFVLYEYGTLARSYSLGVLLVLVACSVIAAPRRRWLPIGLTLALLALTSAFGAILAGALTVGVVIDEMLRRNRSPGAARSRLAVGAGVAMAAFGLLLSYLSARPPDDASLYERWVNPFAPRSGAPALGGIWRAMVPVPEIERTFWNTNIVSARVGVLAVLGALVLLVVAAVLVARPMPLAVWALGAGGTVLFIAARIHYAEASRHLGHVFLAFLAATWLAPGAAAWPGDPDCAPRWRRWEPGRLSRLLTCVLTLHVVAAAIAVGTDLAAPFSNGEQVARFIEREGYSDAVIIGRPDIAASTVAGYLDRSILYSEGDRQGTYVIWDRGRIDERESLSALIAQVSRERRRIILLVDEPLSDPSVLNARLLAHFDDGIVTDEHYWVYEAQRQAP